MTHWRTSLRRTTRWHKIISSSFYKRDPLLGFIHNDNVYRNSHRDTLLHLRQHDPSKRGESVLFVFGTRLWPEISSPTRSWWRRYHYPSVSPVSSLREIRTTLWASGDWESWAIVIELETHSRTVFCRSKNASGRRHVDIHRATFYAIKSKIDCKNRSPKCHDSTTCGSRAPPTVETVSWL